MKTLRLFVIASLVGLVAPLFGQGAAGKTGIPNAAQPQLTVGSDGRVWLVYAQTAAAARGHEHHKAAAAPGESTSHDAKGHEAKGHKEGGHGPGGRPGDVFVASSKDGGATFNPPVKVAHVPQLMVGNRRGPRIAANGDHITVTMIAHELVAFTSIDGGRTWSRPVTVNEVPTSAREGLHDLATGPDGRTFVTWLDLRSGKMELWGADSLDGGGTWGKNELVYRSPDKSICECCHPTALFDAQGNLAVMWRNSVEGSRDMWMATRANGAKMFSPAKKLGEGTWKLNACPMDGGRIVALGGGKFGSVWQRAGEVFFAPGSGPEILLGKGKQPIGIAHGGETLIFWQQGTDLVSTRVAGGSEPVKHASDARFAVAIALPDDGGVVLAYEQGSAKEKQSGVVVDRL